MNVCGFSKSFSYFEVIRLTNKFSSLNTEKCPKNLFYHNYFMILMEASELDCAAF